jgi:hypothetical protein
MSALQNVSFTNYSTAFGFVGFLDALQRGRYISEAYDDFQASAREAVWKAGLAQEVMLQFREDLRIVVGRITTIMSAGEFLNCASSSAYLI